ncbi:MAG: hypothetical protein UR82_C0003G0002 [Candidatus Moranbacteria bacterium GW2011_GWF1_35_5]|nr:MAG: hypothetical protein UR82_C0003G0002 [Candidatus Moranbacteria bacterium GW2011_GWF1_35_5]
MDIKMDSLSLGGSPSAEDNINGAKKDNGSRTEKLKSKAEDIETLKTQIEFEMGDLHKLFKELKEKLKSSTLIDHLMIDDFESAIERAEKRKDNKAKLTKIKEIQGKLEEIINGEKNKESFNGLILATNKCLEDLKNKYRQYILDNKLGDFEREQFNQIVLEYKERIQGAVAENNKKELEEIGFDLRATLEGDIEIEDEEAEKSLEILKKEIELEEEKTNKAIDEIEKIIKKANIRGEVAVFTHSEMGALTFNKEDIENFRKTTADMASEDGSLHEMISRRREMEGFVEKYKKQSGEKEIDSVNPVDDEEIKVVDEIFIDEDGDANEELTATVAEKEVPPIIKKAIKDKNFAYDSMEYEINKELKKVSIESEQTIAKEIEKSKKDLVVAFDKLRDNFAEFRKNIADSEEDKSFLGKLERIINDYAKKIHKFDVIEKCDVETLKEISLLHNEMQGWADKNWVKLYERKMGVGVFEEVAGKDVLQDLDHTDLHGSEIPTVKSAEEIERYNKIRALEKEYGNTGTIYSRDDKKTGFPIDSFEIVGYELGEKDVDTFVVVKKLVDDEEVETRIDLKRFKKDKRYVRVVEDVNNEDDAGEGAIETEEEILSAKEISELVALVKEIKEEKGNLDIDKIELSKKFKDFLWAHKEEKEFNKGLLKAIHLLDDRFAEIDRKFRQMNVDGQATRELLDEIKKIDSEMVALWKSDWKEELKKFKLEKEDLEFSEMQKDKIKIITELFEKKKFIENLLGEAEWRGYREMDKETAIELIVKANLRLVMGKMKKVFDNDEISEKAINKIFDSLNKK